MAAEQAKLGRLGFGIGLVGSAASAALWLVSVSFNPYVRRTTPTGSGSGTVAIGMIALAALGGLASFRRDPWLMYGIFVVSFVPMGFYMLLTPGIFKYIGVANLFYLGAAILIHCSRRASSRSGGRSNQVPGT